jgi:hypothetical protein
MSKSWIYVKQKISVPQMPCRYDNLHLVLQDTIGILYF